MNRHRIKFCGITRIEDAHAAVALGVDAIGLVLTQKSPRFAGIARAREIRESLPPFVTAVALFMDDEPGWIAAAVSAIQPDLLQFHGGESALECLRYGCRYLKAVAMGGGMEPDVVIAAHPQATGFVLDGHRAGEIGGRGKTFDWARISGVIKRPFLLAGGLTCDNVGAAIRAARPYAVDVSSGIEASGIEASEIEAGGITAGGIAAAPGIKDAEKMRRFVTEVQRACGKR